MRWLAQCKEARLGQFYLSANSPRFTAGWQIYINQPGEQLVPFVNKRQNYLQALSLTGPATVQLLAHVRLSCVWLSAFVDINRDIPSLDGCLALAI